MKGTETLSYSFSISFSMILFCFSCISLNAFRNSHPFPRDILWAHYYISSSLGDLSLCMNSVHCSSFPQPLENSLTRMDWSQDYHVKVHTSLTHGEMVSFSCFLSFSSLRYNFYTILSANKTFLYIVQDQDFFGFEIPFNSFATLFHMIHFELGSFWAFKTASSFFVSENLQSNLDFLFSLLFSNQNCLAWYFLTMIIFFLP